MNRLHLADIMRKGNATIQTNVFKYHNRWIERSSSEARCLFLAVVTMQELFLKGQRQLNKEHSSAVPRERRFLL